MTELDRQDENFQKAVVGFYSHMEEVVGKFVEMMFFAWNQIKLALCFQKSQKECAKQKYLRRISYKRKIKRFRSA